MKCKDVQVSRGDGVAREDGLLEGNDVVRTAVRVEAGLDVGEGHDGAVGTAATVQGAVVSAKVWRTARLRDLPKRRREADGIVEGQL